jgi:hypothetical protein
LLFFSMPVKPKIPGNSTPPGIQLPLLLKK